jgi:hypothetical protein
VRGDQQKQHDENAKRRIYTAPFLWQAVRRRTLVMASRAAARIDHMICASQRWRECIHDGALYFFSVVLIDQPADKVVSVIIE